MGIEFKGGAVFTTPKTAVSVAHVTEDAKKASGHEAIVQELGTGGMRIQISGLDTDDATGVKKQLATDLKVDANQINADLVGPSWGE